MCKCFVFGAHSRAWTQAVYLTSLNKKVLIQAFLVDDDEKNPEEIDGIPVINPEKVPDEDRKYPVYLAIRGVNHNPVEDRLRKLGFSDIIPVTVALDAEFRKKFLRKLYIESGRQFCMIDDLSADGLLPSESQQSVKIYEVCSAYDKPLEKDHYIRKSYETPIQVGAALTDVRIGGCNIFDDSGDNISSMNRQLCEETALYWMWKHAKEDYTGLVHYRRHFIFPDDWFERMISNDVDVILPIPLYIMPSVEENYRYRHISDDWDKIMEIIKNRSQKEYDFARKLFEGNLYFPLNIFVMKRGVMNDYCEWLFPRLFELIEQVGEREDTYQNRFPAFMAERLLTLYFELNRDNYKIVYADKGFLQ